MEPVSDRFHVWEGGYMSVVNARDGGNSVDVRTRVDGPLGTLLRRHLDRLRSLTPRVTGRVALERDLSLHNDVLLSLLMVAQRVVDLAGAPIP